MIMTSTVPMLNSRGHYQQHFFNEQLQHQLFMGISIMADVKKIKKKNATDTDSQCNVGKIDIDCTYTKP